MHNVSVRGYKFFDTITVSVKCCSIHRRSTRMIGVRIAITAANIDCTAGLNESFERRAVAAVGSIPQTGPAVLVCTRHIGARCN